MDYSEILRTLESLSDPKAVEGMARFGITPDKVYGVSMPNLRKLAKGIKKDHALAESLWLSGSREARILAAMTDDPKQVTEEQMEHWASEFTYWEICDQVCMNLFEKIPLAWQKAVEWGSREDESHKRAGFALMACLAWHDKKARDEQFEPFFPVIKQGSTDGRNMVKKAVNWALRNIGKRNRKLNARAIATAEEIHKIDSKVAKWVASDAIRELKSESVQRRLKS
jgi:3-methyladenine DNA glycosylase AlkD